MSKIVRFILLIVIVPLSVVWDWVYRIRRFLYSYEFFTTNSYRVPIISVGNLTFGGTGKTPFVVWLARYLEKKSKSTMILMRGYKGQLEASSGILRSRSRLGHNPLEFGDEALLLSHKLPKSSIVVGRKRSENLEKYFHEENPDCVILDDGHQHLKLGRDLNIVLFDALMPLARYKTPPWGYLREGLTALSDADIILIGRVDQSSTTHVNMLKILLKSKITRDVPIGEIGYRPVALHNNRFEKVMNIQELQGRKIVCVAALASPLSFFKLAQSLGADICHKFIFPDHHHYKDVDVDEIVSVARKNDALILTTEKDMVKIKRLRHSEEFFYLEIDVYFLKGEEEVCKKIDNILS